MLKSVLIISTLFILLFQFRNYFTKNIIANVLKVLFFYVFFFGVMEVLNPPNFVLKFTIDLFIAILAVFLIEKQNKGFPGKVFFLLFTLLYIFSVLFNESDIYHSSTFFRIFFYPYLLFLITKNLDINTDEWKKLNLFIISLFLAQIYFSVVKLLFVGVTEKTIVGSVSTSGGTLSTMIPLFAICFLLSFYLHTRQSKYLLLAAGFLFMGFVGAKRGIWFYTPFLLLLSAFLYNRANNTNILKLKSLRYIMLAMVLVPIVIFFGSRYNKTLNPDEKVGGDVDLQYLSDYAIEYTFNESEEVTHGRGANLKRVFQKMTSGPILNFFFGYGPDSAKGVTTYGQGIWGEFKIRGPVSGFPTHFVQIGILAVLVILLAYRKIFKVFIKIYKSSNNQTDKILSFGGAMAALLFFIDYFTYSSAFMATTFPISFTLFYLMGYLLNKNRETNAAILSPGKHNYSIL